MDLEYVEDPGRFFNALSRDLKSIALSNIQYFQAGKHSHHAKFHIAFRLLHEYLDMGIEPSYSELSRCVNIYDFSTEIKGNGYRSLLRVVQKCCLHLLQLCRYISTVRDSILFRKKFYARELECYVSALGQLRAVLYYALKLVHYCQDGELFVDESKLNTEVADQLVMEVESLNLESFYGRCLGFQFCQSMQRPLQVLAIAMASYSEGYLETSQMMQVATSVFNSGKYILDPELRAQQMVKVTRTADVKFCKAFWGFTESSFMHQLPSFVCPSVEVNEVIVLGPDAFELQLVEGSDTVVITPPCAHTGPGHVYTRLICAHARDGQHELRKGHKLKSPPAVKPRTSGLIVHIHGGGFVAQSSKSHEVYLREWAVTVDVPILSVDYSLAPELPFPRALEDCFYAFAWAVKNCEQLGSTGKRIVIVGDSAGGNLAIATAMRAASFGIRPPDGIVAVYPCTVARYTPSPSRLMSLMDPVLPVGLVTRCLVAYAGISEEQPQGSLHMEDVHSPQSLSSIQVNSYEQVDSDWMIVARDSEEAEGIDLNSPESPSPSGTSGVLDFSPGIGLLDTTVQAKPTVSGKSTPVISEQDIFSQLESDGSFAFPSGVEHGNVSGHEMDTVSKELRVLSGSQAVDGGGEREENENFNRSEVKSGSADTRFASFGLFQEQAKLVVEGAQNMLSKVTSYLPTADQVSTRNMLSQVSSYLPTSGQDFFKGPASFPSSAASLEPHLSSAASAASDKKNASAPGHSSACNKESLVGEGDKTSKQDIHKQVNLLGCIPPSDSNECTPVHSECDCNHRTDTPADVNKRTSPQDEILADGSNSMVNSLSFHTNSSSQTYDTAESSPCWPHVHDILESESFEIEESVSMECDSSTAQFLPSSSASTAMLVLPAVCEQGDDTWQEISSEGVEDVRHMNESNEVGDKKLSQSDTLMEEGANSNTSHNIDGEDRTSSDVDKVNKKVVVDCRSIPEGGLCSSTEAESSKPTVPNTLNLFMAEKQHISEPTAVHQPGKHVASNSKSGESCQLKPSLSMEGSSQSLQSAGPSTSMEGSSQSLQSAGPSTSSVTTCLPTSKSDGFLRRGSLPSLKGLFSHGADDHQAESLQGESLHSSHKTSMSPSDFERHHFTDHSPLHILRKAAVVNNPYMSPLLAPNDLLKGLPMTSIVVSHLDPLLDDSVMFAKRLQRLNIPVGLHLVDDLPHGFLNFAMLSLEAKQAADLCGQKIAEMLRCSDV